MAGRLVTDNERFGGIHGPKLEGNMLQSMVPEMGFDRAFEFEKGGYGYHKLPVVDKGLVRDYANRVLSMAYRKG